MGAYAQRRCALIVMFVLAHLFVSTWLLWHTHLALSQSGADGAALDDFNRRFVEVDQGTLFHLILAANRLGMKPLLDVTCKAVADMIKGKDPEEIRAHFNMLNDFTPEEEEEEVRRENAWCEDI